MKQEILSAIKKGKTFAIIPARSGSKAIRGKNIMPLGGFPMIAYTIAAARLSAGIDRILVSTDSEEYAKIARKYGGETPFLRPKEISGDGAADFEFMAHAIDWLYENEGALPEFWVHLRTTTPLRDPCKIENAIELFKADESAHCLRSAHPARFSPYKCLVLSEEKYFSPLFSGMTLDEANNPRQSFCNVFIPDGYVDVLRTSFIVKNDLLHGEKMLAFCLEPSIDVDNPKDFEELEREMKRRPNKITKFLEDFEGAR